MKRSRFSGRQVIGILREARAGSPVKAVCAAHNIRVATYRAWKRKYGAPERIRCDNGPGTGAKRRSPAAGSPEGEQSEAIHCLRDPGLDGKAAIKTIDIAPGSPWEPTAG